MHAMKEILTQELLISKQTLLNNKDPQRLIPVAGIPPGFIYGFFSSLFFLFFVCVCVSFTNVFELIMLQTVHVDQLSGASTVLFTFTIDRGITWEVRIVA